MNTDYFKLLQEIDSIVTSGATLGEILQNTCKLLKTKVYHYDWVGFYILEERTLNLVLGPFYGKPTEHTIIPIGKGVCGQVAVNKKLKTVQNVCLESNYIACSIDVQSEIVVPILKDGKFVAEIDIDSHSVAPFTVEDEIFLTSVCQKLSGLF